MKIKSLNIEGVGGIKKIELTFDDQVNLICGPNGIGKTTILECVAHSFSINRTSILKRNVQSKSGNFNATIESSPGTNHYTQCVISSFDPNQPSQISGLHTYSKKLLSLKVNRTFTYQSLGAVHKDVEKGDHITYEEAKNGTNISEVKNWFVNRYLYSAHDGALNSTQIHNLELAKKSFSLLDPTFEFSRVLASSNEIMINTPNGEIYYEYLSSGFKSSLSIVFGIIKDIELRFKPDGIKADEFDGVILIDELELHLHPEWQTKIVGIITESFPAAQFIATTHSPHVLQNALPNQIIALSSDNGAIYKRDLANTKYGFKGWSVEEILLDVMAMTDTRTHVYKKMLQGFETSIKEENLDSAEHYYNELNLLLHPNNTLRKLLKLELEFMRGSHD